jgi:hypothetical protein
MAAIVLADAVSTNTSGDAVALPKHIRRAAPQRVVQISISGTITVAIEGRMTPAAPWITIYSTAASAVQLVALMPEMRVTTTGASGGPSASVYLDAETA